MKVNGPDATANTGRLWQFAQCEFDELRWELRVRGRAVELERKPLDVLFHLLAKGGQVVTKEELLDSVWPGVMVVEASLATAISKLRKALADQDVIQTVPKVGYRLSVLARCVEPAETTWNAAIASLPPAVVEPSAPANEPAKKAWRYRSLSRWVLAPAAMLAALLGYFATRPHAKRQAMVPVVAILPFENASANHDFDFLRAAVPDEIANTLAPARSLTIRPLASAARFSGPFIDFREAARVLDVNRIVTGHFVVAGNQLQITMEAVDPAENRVTWRETLNLATNNLLALQQQVAGMTRWKLAHELGVTEIVPEVAPRATNEQAYELYLKSTALDWDETPNREGIDLLRHAVLLDPNYAPAWGQLSLRYYRSARYGGGGAAMMAFSDAAAEKELALDPDSPEPVAELTIHRTERGEIVKAHETALELLRRRPDLPNNHHVLSYVLRYGGSIDESARECDLTILLAAKFVWGACATTFMELGDYQRSITMVRKDLSSEFSKAKAIDIRLREGNLQEALKIPAPKIPGWDSYAMALSCARQAPQPDVQALAAKVQADDDPEMNYLFASHLAYCGQNEAALRLLKAAINGNYCSFPAMDKDPLFASLRTSAEFRRVRAAGALCHEYFVSNRERSPVMSKIIATNAPHP